MAFGDPSGRHAVDPVATDTPPAGDTDRPRPGRTWGYLAVGILVVVAGSLAALFSSALRHQVDISLKRQPAPYASLYFTSPATLPSDLPTDKSYPVSFTVANHDVDRRSFRYEVTLTSRSARNTAVGRVAVPSQGTAETTVTVTPVQPCQPCKVVVALPTQHATIYFSAGSAQ